MSAESSNSKANNYALKKVLAICTVILAASFVGFVVETVWMAWRHNFIDNRGMHFPLLIGYGLAVAVLYLLFGTPSAPRLLLKRSKVKNCIMYFIAVFVFISIGEALLGYAVQYFLNVRWWNYTKLPLHIGRYTSIPTSFTFTVLICFFHEKVVGPLMKYLINIDLVKHAVIILPLTIIAILDCAYAYWYMYQNHHICRLFRIYIN